MRSKSEVVKHAKIGEESKSEEAKSPPGRQQEQPMKSLDANHYVQLDSPTQEDSQAASRSQDQINFVPFPKLEF